MDQEEKISHPKMSFKHLKRERERERGEKKRVRVEKEMVREMKKSWIYDVIESFGLVGCG